MHVVLWCSEKMASSSSRKRVRYTLDVHFGTPEEKEAFVHRMKHVRQLLSHAGNPCADNYSFMNSLFEAVEDTFSQPTFDPSVVPRTRSFLRNSGTDYFKSLCAGIEV